MSRFDHTKEYWDGLQSKEVLYKEFDSMSDNLQATFAQEPEENYYKDGEFKAVTNSMKDGVKVLLAVLPDIANHFAAGAEMQRCEVKASDLLADNFNLDIQSEIAVAALVICKLLDTDDVKSFYKRVESGNGITEARAANQAFRRYMVFKDEDKAKLEAFKLTPEYHIQETEMKLGLRDHIEVPE